MTKMFVLDTDTNKLVPLGGPGGAIPVTGLSGGGSGDASAANQVAQIALETAIRDRLPSAGASSEATLAALNAKVTEVDTGAVVGTVGSYAANPSASFNRPADTSAYTAGDLIANSVTAVSVTRLQFMVARVEAGSFMIRRAKIRTTDTGALNAAIRLHLFTAQQSPVNGDNGAFSCNGAASYIGAFDVTMDRAFTDGVVGFDVPAKGSDIVVKLSSGQFIYGLLESRSGFTPASASTFTVTLEVLQN